MDAWTLARLAGHPNIRQSMTYVHPSDNALHAAMDRRNGNSVMAKEEIRDNAEIIVSDADGNPIVVFTQQRS